MRALAIALLLVLVAGCVADPAKPGATTPATLDAPSFSRVAIIDPVRSGGEPVLFQTPKGTLLIAAHPGYTHVKAPPGPEVLTPTSGQSYLYRSSDNGATWTAITGPNGGPRNDAHGLSDPDLASNADGSRLVMVDLSVAEPPVSTEVSHDDGAAWPDAQPYATDPVDGTVDRPWLAFANGTYYMVYNAIRAGHWTLRESKDGLAWSDVSSFSDGTYDGAMAAGPDGALYVGHGDKVWYSTDGGKTFASSKMPAEKPMVGITAQRPSVDTAGTVYFAWSEFHDIKYAYSKDDGKTWSAPHTLVEGGTNIWPWPAAGAAGKLAVAWVGTNESNADPSAVKGEWVVHLALISGADTDSPAMWTGAIPNAVVSTGGICIDGTICEAEGKDRRLGDFITVIVDRDGYAQVAYGTTTTGHSISSPAYVKQVAGPRLR